MLELKFMVRVRPFATVKVDEPESVVPFKERLPVLVFVVVKALFKASVPPKSVIGPLMDVAAPMVMLEAFPVLPRVRPPIVFATVRFEIGKLKALVKLLPLGSIVMVPVVLTAVGTSKVTTFPINLTLAELEVTLLAKSEPSAQASLKKRIPKVPPSNVVFPALAKKSVLETKMPYNEPAVPVTVISPPPVATTSLGLL